MNDDAVAGDLDVDTAAPDQPYPGLRSFQRDETHIFFGREGTINDMVDRLGAHRFLAVTGASGAGKSSLVRTGLLDALERGLLAEAGYDWAIADFRPGSQPLTALIAALPGAVGGDFTEDELALSEARLARGPHGLIEWLDEIGFPADRNLLLLVDQFEETFRYHQSDEAAAFVALLLASVRQRGRRVYVVITMRSDFLGECARFAGLAELINDSQFLTPRMSRAQTRAAIENPAKVYDGSVEPALVTRLLNDMGSNPDQLPLMQHVLMLLWEDASHRDPDGEIVLTLAHYEELGGVGGDSMAVAPGRDATRDQTGSPAGNGALSDHLDRVLRDLAPREQQLARTLFRALVHSEGNIGRDVRRPAPLGEIARIADTDPAEFIPVIEAFRGPGRYFLTPAPPVPITPETTIDISHESLIRQWRALRDWVREEFQSAETYEHIETTAQLWIRRQARRLTMPYLGIALAWRQRERPNAFWAGRYGGDFSLAMRFLDSSRRRYLWRSRGTIAAAILLLGGSAGFGLYQLNLAQTRQAELMTARSELQSDRENLRRALSQLKGIELAGELTDYGVPPQDTLQVDVGTKTPRSIPGGSVLATADMGSILGNNPPPVLIDVLADYHAETIPGAVRVPIAGYSGTFTDDIQPRVVTRLNNITNNNKATPLVFFCAGPICWESYNAALRAIHAGYTHVYWYRGGQAAWHAAGLDFKNIFAEANTLRDKLDVLSGLPPTARWAQAALLSETTSTMVGLQVTNLADAAAAALLGRDELQRLRDRLGDNLEFLADLAASNVRLGTVLEKQRQFDGAIAAYRAALVVQQGVATKDPKNAARQTDIATAFIKIGDLQAQQRHFADALDTYRSAMKAVQQGADIDQARMDWLNWLAFLDRKLAETLGSDGQAPGSRDYYRAALTADEQRAGKFPDNSAIGSDILLDLRKLSEVDGTLKQPDEAIAAYREAITFLSASAGKETNGTAWHMDLVNGEQELGELLEAQGKLDDALQVFTTALATAKEIAAKDPKNTDAQASYTTVADHIGGLSWHFILAGAFQKGLDAADMAIAAAPTSLWIQGNRAHALMMLGRTDEARAIYLRYRGQQTHGDIVWDRDVLDDFADLRKAKFDNPLMAEIERQFAAPKPQ